MCLGKVGKGKVAAAEDDLPHEQVDKEQKWMPRLSPALRGIQGKPDWLASSE